jgi:hypothetical protein
VSKGLLDSEDMRSLKVSVVLGLSGKAVTASSEQSSSSAKTDAGVVSVLDFEDKIRAKEKEFVSPEEKNAFLYPTNELAVSRVPRLFSAGNVAVDPHRQEGFMASALGRYTRDFVTVAHRFAEHNGQTIPKKPLEWTDGTFAPATTVDDAISTSDALDESILANGSGTARKKSPHHHGKQPSLFSGCSLSSVPSDSRPVADLPRAMHFGSAKVQALVHVKEIRATAGKQTEPLFLSICMFNVRKRERVTESIHVFLNPAEVALSLGDRISRMVAELKAQRALFPLDDLSPDVFLVFMLEKTLRAADVDDTLDELLKGASQSAKVDEVRMSASRLGSFRQPLAWAARCLFEKGRSILGTDIVLDFTRFSSRAGINDAQLVAHLERMAERASRGTSGNENASSMAVRQVPFQVVIDFDLLPSDRVLPHLVTPGLELAASGLLSSVNSVCDPKELVRIVQQFSSPENITDPSREGCNDMFMFLDWANFSKAHRRIKTVSIRVSLHENDDGVGQPGLQAFYGRFSGRFDRDCVCAVQYHERRLSMYEQIKIRLPTVLRPQHHLLFTFSHVQCNLGKLKKGDSPETIFGYACFPLFSDSRIVPDGSYGLPVVSGSSFPRSRYLESEGVSATAGAGGASHEEADVPMFGFHTKLVSTLYTQDPSLDSWLNSSVSSPSTSCEQLARASAGSKIQFLPAILDRLWEMMCVGTEAASSAAVTQIANICEIVSAASQRGVRASLTRAE